MSIAIAESETASFLELCRNPRHLIVSGVPEGLDALLLSQMVQNEDGPDTIIHISRDDQRMNALQGALKFFAPDVRLLIFPAWDCVPYDRASPNVALVSRRIATLARLHLSSKKEHRIVLTTMNAVMQRVPERSYIKNAVFRVSSGASVKMEQLVDHLNKNGFQRTETVIDPGDYALRGGILDLFPPGHGHPLRLDFFGDTLESIRRFDPESQRTIGRASNLVLLPITEVPSGDQPRRLFRRRYLELFGAVTGDDPLYEAVSQGTWFQGIEHWLPLFHENLETLFDYIPDATVTLDQLSEDARRRRLEQIEDHYEARMEALEQKAFGAPPYKPVPPELLFLNDHVWNTIVDRRRLRSFTSFEVPENFKNIASISFRARNGRNFSVERQSDASSVFDVVVGHVRSLQNQKKTVIIACWSQGARERMSSLLNDHQLGRSKKVDSWKEVLNLDLNEIGLAVLGLETGFETPDLAVISEQDILGDRLTSPSRSKPRSSDILFDVSSMNIGDLMVHADHGIGQFAGLKTIEAAGAPHDCLELIYHGNDKLYLPVENIELLTRYGAQDAGAQLDRLGGVAWQSRKARLKKRIRDIAENLIKVAAARELRDAPSMTPPHGIYEEFCAGFAFEETEDQRTAIEAVVQDLSSGRPMDRLVCGDVGFGKTEIALRSAMVAVMEGFQVAVIVPTTLLARQHYATFSERFRGFPVRIAQASRLVSSKDLAQAKKDVASGQVDIIIGTHVLLGKSIRFENLGLIIVDEEQHFGVQHKERLKQFRESVHVLTLTATPIPRTLQMALSGVRELSLITTPPLDRLAVRSFILPFDPVMVREALLRERYRGGQSFYVCPRISDLDETGAFLREHVSELNVAQAHGQMPASRLDDVMNKFYERKFDVLLSTTIVESGLDIPTANTMIIHRADRFGLAQLYQLRGRIGRSKTRAYAYFTIPVQSTLTNAAEKRLKVLQSLDTLGAGFRLASHDLDIRGGGNLLGEEQSGHIREVGYELYQSMLEEAIAALKGGDFEDQEDQWSPQISMGTAVLIPEYYVPDLQLRLGLYRRLSRFTDDREIERFAAELVDRFGQLPEEVEHLLDIVKIKVLCRLAGIQSIETGPKGAVIVFRNNKFSDPDGLIMFISKRSEQVKLQPDHKLIYFQDWDTPQQRLNGMRSLVRELAELVLSSDGPAN